MKAVFNYNLSGRSDRRSGRLCSATTSCSMVILTLLGSANAFAATATANKKVASFTQSIRPHRAGSVSQSSNDVTLDFVQADINDVLKALAVQTGSNIVSSTDVKGTITVSLAHVTLEQALDMVARLSGYQYAKANNAYIVGTPAGIAAYSQPTVQGGPTTTEVVTTHYASVDDVSGLMKLRFPNLQVSTGTAINGAKVGGSSQAIVLSGPQNDVDQAKALIESFESNLATQVAQESTEIYTVHYASIGDLITIVNSLVPSVVITPGPGQGFKVSAPSASAAASSSSASAIGTSPSGSSGSSGSGSSSGSGATGSSQSSTTGPTSLLLTGTAVDIQKALDLLAKIDIKPKELLFEAKVTEINDTDAKNIGLNWSFAGATTRIGELTDNVANGPATLGDNGKTGSILKFGTFGRTAISNAANVTLDALIQTGDAKLLSDPNIASINGYPAQVFIGDTVNYIQSISQTTTGQNVTTASVQVGVILRVTGTINPDGYITLNIHPEVSSITQYIPVPGGGQLPQIATRYADTTVRVKDGDTIAIGGLIQNNDLTTIQKVPFFGDLPFFGNFFKDTKHNLTKNEVVFFLKTSVMKED